MHKSDSVSSVVQVKCIGSPAILRLVALLDPPSSHRAPTLDAPAPPTASSRPYLFHVIIWIFIDEMLTFDSLFIGLKFLNIQNMESKI